MGIYHEYAVIWKFQRRVAVRFQHETWHEEFTDLGVVEIDKAKETVCLRNPELQQSLWSNMTTEKNMPEL